MNNFDFKTDVGLTNQFLLRHEVRLLGNVAVTLSFVCSLSIWVLATIYVTTGVDLLLLTGWQWLIVNAVGVIFALIGGILRSRSWWLAFPVSCSMFFLVMYVMGT